MPFTDLRSFLTVLERQGRLVRVAREVDPRFEIAAVLDRLSKEDSRAIIFEHVRGSRLPVVGNVWGSFANFGAFFGVQPDAVSRTWGALEDGMQGGPPAGGEGEACEYEELTLTNLPILTHCERDAGPYITAGVVLARDPVSGAGNLSYHRMQLQGPERLGLRITPGNHLGVYMDAAEAAGQNLPALILISPPPAVMLAAAARLPLRVDEMGLAAAFTGAPLPIQPSSLPGLGFPVGTEIIIEGEILAGVRETEGPFGDFMDVYLPAGLNHVFQVKRVLARPGAMYYGLLSGSVEQVLIMGVPTAANILRAVRRVVPSTIDAAIWPFAYQCVIKMREEFDGQAKQAILAAFGAEPSYLKTCTVVDDDVDIYNPVDVAWAVACRSRPDADVMVIPNVPSFRRDPEAVHWGRVGIDATIPWGHRAEFARKRVPGSAELDLAKYLSHS